MVQATSKHAVCNFVGRTGTKLHLEQGPPLPVPQQEEVANAAAREAREVWLWIQQAHRKAETRDGLNRLVGMTLQPKHHAQLGKYVTLDSTGQQELRHLTRQQAMRRPGPCAAGAAPTE